ncbi:MAG TPA: hypothetical protein VGC18_07620 [Lacisediminihabitans sp.]|uniref:hypothetical protein n=1 Tax=Lacisediminihabitans sp. TaxID=2787631 RepID=UPI002ED93610
MMRTGFETGYELHPIQRQAAIATPGRWRDGLLVGAASDGAIEIYDLEAATSRVLWHHADLTGMLETGEPVALHADYDVLAAGGSYYSVCVSR